MKRKPGAAYSEHVKLTNVRAGEPLSTLETCIRSSLVAMLAIGVAFLLASVFHAANHASQAELNLRALECLTVTTERFIVMNRRWPQTPEELRAIQYDTLGFQWPEDEKEVFERASMNFGCDLAAVARSRADAFPFIRSREPRFLYAETPRIERVIWAAQEVSAINE